MIIIIEVENMNKQNLAEEQGSYQPAVKPTEKPVAGLPLVLEIRPGHPSVEGLVEVFKPSEYDGKSVDYLINQAVRGSGGFRSSAELNILGYILPALQGGRLLNRDGDKMAGKAIASEYARPKKDENGEDAFLYLDAIAVQPGNLY
jgi:hypothetical protein